MDDILLGDFRYINSYNLPFDRLRNKTILITGVSGFITTYLTKSLLSLNLEKNLNFKIIGIARDRDKVEARFGDLVKRNDFVIRFQDVCDPPNIEYKIDYIIHAASIASPKYFKDKPLETILPNTYGTNNYLKLAHKNNSEFLFFSTGGVYGETRGLTSEKSYGYLDPLDERSCYHESKRLGETLCMAWYREFGVKVKMIRPFHVYGPGMDIEDGRAIADFIKGIIGDREIVIKGDGLTRRSFCYMADFITGLYTVLLKGESGEAYNITNDRSIESVGNVAKLLVSLYKDLDIKLIYSQRNGEDKYLVSKVPENNPCILKLKKLGWQPLYSLTDGFRRTVDSFL
jgi:nucleoside-diphosphate-sugar epimerase